MQAVLHPDGCLSWTDPEGGPQMLRATIGRGGITDHKREGDGATPAGHLPLRRVLYRLDRVPAPLCAVPVEPIARSDGWCDDPDDPGYNQPISLPSQVHHEELWRADALYDIVAVLGWNDAPVTPGRGSAIFLHVENPAGTPTDGCIALPLAALQRILARGLTEVLVLTE